MQAKNKFHVEKIVLPIKVKLLCNRDYLQVYILFLSYPPPISSTLLAECWKFLHFKRHYLKMFNHTVALVSNPEARLNRVSSSCPKYIEMQQRTLPHLLLHTAWQLVEIKLRFNQRGRSVITDERDTKGTFPSLPT